LLNLIFKYVEVAFAFEFLALRVSASRSSNERGRRPFCSIQIFALVRFVLQSVDKARYTSNTMKRKNETSTASVGVDALVREGMASMDRRDSDKQCFTAG
jgi:hypothetical protein